LRSETRRPDVADSVCDTDLYRNWEVRRVRLDRPLTVL
jgi:hypothetical protein